MRKNVTIVLLCIHFIPPSPQTITGFTRPRTENPHFGARQRARRKCDETLTKAELEANTSHIPVFSGLFDNDRSWRTAPGPGCAPP